MLALIMFITYLDEETGGKRPGDPRALQAASAGRRWLWRPLRDLPTLRAGFEERADDVSAVVDLARTPRPDIAGSAADLFEDVKLTTAIDPREQTADELWALFETTSAYPRLEPGARVALRSDVAEAIDRLGGTLRSNELAVLVTAHARQLPYASQISTTCRAAPSIAASTKAPSSSAEADALWSSRSIVARACSTSSRDGR